MWKPDVDPRALRKIVDRALPGADRPVVARTADGVSTQVYRVDRGGRTFYLRVAEEREASLAPEAFAQAELRARGVRVPEIAYYDAFDEALERSVLVTTEIPGRSLARHHAGVDVRSVLVAAGRDLAVVNELPVRGFGWIKRDRRVVTHLEAEWPTLRHSALGGLEKCLAALGGFLGADERRVIGHVVQDGAWLAADHGHLAHGDLDATHIYHRDGEYTGIIDFGEIRGADRFYDLGHFALHDGETLPNLVLPYLLEGYGEVAPLPPDHERRIRSWSVLIGVRALARSADRPRTAYQGHLVGAVRKSLGALMG